MKGWGKCLLNRQVMSSSVGKRPLAMWHDWHAESQISRDQQNAGDVVLEVQKLVGTALTDNQEGRRKLKIGRKEALAGWPVTPLRGRKVKGQSHHSPGCFTPWPKISHVFGMGRSTNFKLGIRMEYDDPHHRHGRWPPNRKLWVAAEVTTCIGRIVVAPVHAAQLV